MRAIKFKAKAKNDTLYYKKGDWIYGHYTYFDDGRHMIYVQELNTWFGIDETTLCQYTGIQDRNGVEIYEDDIVDDDWYSSSYGSGVVSWNGDAFYQVEYKQKTNYSMELLGNIIENDIEVVGNIHDKENEDE